MAKNFKTQNKLAKAASRLQMIVEEFFQKWRNFSLKLAIYNTAWWVGNYCSRLKKLQYWATKRITVWMDIFLERQKLTDEVIANVNVCKMGG